MDLDSGDELAVAPDNGRTLVQLFREHLHVGLDPEGLFVLDVSAGPPRGTFRAVSFAVHPTDDPTVVDLIDGPTRYRLPHALFGGRRRRVEVRAVRRTQRDIALVVDALVAVCRASVATGNPVVWG